MSRSRPSRSFNQSRGSKFQKGEIIIWRCIHQGHPRDAAKATIIEQDRGFPYPYKIQFEDGEQLLCTDTELSVMN